VAPHALAVNACASLDGGVVATGCGDGGVRLFRVDLPALPGTAWTAAATPLAALPALPGQCCGPVRALCRVPGYPAAPAVGLAAVSNDGFLRLWASGRSAAAGWRSGGGGATVSAVHAGGDGYLYAVCASPAGAPNPRLYTGGDDGVVTVWTYGLLPLQRLALPCAVYGLAALLGPRAGDVAMACADKYCRVWSPAASGRALGSGGAAAAVRAAEVAARAGPVGMAAAALAAMLSAQPPPQVFQGEGAVNAAARAATGGGPGGGPPPGASSSAAPTGATSAAAAAYECNFPVELSEGGALTLSWNRGEVADAVARRFLAAHGLGLSQLPDVVAFVAQAEASLPPVGPRAAGAPPGRALSEGEKQAMVAQVAEVCGDATRATSALERTGWVSADAAVSAFFDGN
jgi:hypothetical protein